MKIRIKNKISKLAIIFSLFLPTRIFAQWNIDDPDVVDLNLSGTPILTIASNIVYWFLGMLEVISLIAFIVAGIIYLTASGDETQAEKAKKAMTYAIIGVIVGLSGFVILQAAMWMLGGSSMF